MTENEWLIVAHNIISDCIDQVVDYCGEHPDEEHVSTALAGAVKLAKACSLIETLVQEMQQQDRGQSPVKVEGYAIIPQDVAKRLLDWHQVASIESINPADIAVLQEACAEPE